MNLPTRLRDTRKLLNSFDLRQIEATVAEEARAQLVIIGPVNSGKSTLFNQLKGQRVSNVSPVPGTTTEPLTERFGPFWLVDTPGFGEAAGIDRANRAMGTLDQANVVILVLDASAGLRQDDVDLYRQVRMQGLPVVPVLNKIDLLKRSVEAVKRDAELKLGTPIIPVSAKKGTNVAEQLIPAIIDSHPRMAVTIGRHLPRFRKKAAGRIIRESAMIGAIISAEPVPGIVIPLLIAVQVRMLLRLAAIYGQTMSVARARELISAIAGGIAIRYGAQELAKLIPGPGWLIAGGVAATGTVALGNTAIVFFSESLSPAELRRVYKNLRWKLRRKRVDEALSTYEIDR